eukprot:Blabericola_migrator_1__8552@NODE_446_length_8402_cov_75_646551_g349_i0_p5_GENE_NODE_446_length_8402_cov_75_646551_g349_i0NODE_446_length_8402_cov_75_646551_g349_i0_p5_ORF_typecomplete_len173_score3_13zfCCHC_3/PF13917_6/8_3e03zfCCHC_3/PF13917_6/0_55_NODE_446_length_8402_cov_75_646551_g349_i012331751
MSRQIITKNSTFTAVNSQAYSVKSNSGWPRTTAGTLRGRSLWLRTTITHQMSQSTLGYEPTAHDDRTRLGHFSRLSRTGAVRSACKLHRVTKGGEKFGGTLFSRRFDPFEQDDTSFDQSDADACIISVRTHGRRTRWLITIRFCHGTSQCCSKEGHCTHQCRPERSGMTVWR